MWTFHMGDRSTETERSRTEELLSRLRNLEYRELDLVSRLSILHERHELYPREVTDRQVAELDRKLDDIRAQIAALGAELPMRRDSR